jgi:hypothetical protein
MRVRTVVGLVLAICIAGWAVVLPPPAVGADGSEVLRFACAAKKNGQLRHSASASGCTKQEVLLTLSVATPSLVCATSDGSVYKVTRANECAKQLKGTTLTIPTSAPQYFCAQPSALLRRVQALTECSASDLKLVSANNAPSGLALSPSTVAENVGIGTAVGTLSASDNDPGDALTFALTAGVGSEDNSDFTLNGAELRTAAAVDFETKSSYSIRVTATDAGGLTQASALTVSVTDVPENHSPTDISLSGVEVPENAATDVGTLSTQDADPGDSFTYTLVSDGSPNDNSLFAVTGSTLSTTGLDHEGAGPGYVVTVQTDDGHGGTRIESFSVTATDVNEAPSGLALDPSTVDENGGAGTVGTLTVGDPDAGDTHSFTLVTGDGDADNGAFDIVGDAVVTRDGLDFEHGPYSIRVRGEDAGGLATTAALTVFVTDLNDAPTSVDLDPAVVAENQPAGTSVGTLTATDQDAGDAHTFAVTGGATGLFTVDGNQLRTTQPLDFESGSTRSVTVRADDGHGGTVERSLTVTVTNVNEGPTSVSLSPAQVAENAPAGTTVGTLSSQDPDGPDLHTYALVAGTGDAGNASFQVVGAELRTLSPLDFEAVNTFSVRVRATDSTGASTEQVFTIGVTDVNEAPDTLTLTGSDVAENRPAATTIGTLSSSDPDAGDSATYSLPVGAADNSLFAVTGSTLKTGAVLDYETKDTYTVVARVTDSGGLSHQETLTIHVLDGNDAPTAVADSYSGAVGNTRAVLGTSASGAHVTLAGSLPLANDTDPDGSILTSVPETVATAGGGTVVINSDGSFVYTPGVGDKSQTDTFTYQVSDGEFTASGTVSIDIGDTLVWYVDNSAAGTGTGQSHTPFTSTAQISGSSGPDGAGDLIFLHSGTSPYRPLQLLNGQELWGQPEGLTVSGSQVLAASGTNPVISAGSSEVALQLATGNDVRRVDVQAPGFGAIGVLSFGGDLTMDSNSRVSANGSLSRAFVFQSSTSGTAWVDSQIDSTGSTAVQVTGNAAAATANFRGPITGHNATVELNNTHAGTVVNFSGGLALDNTDRAGLTAQTAGTVTVTGSANSVRTTTAQAVRIVSTRIGAAGVTFQRVDADGGSSTAVDVNGTGTAGSFTVTGNSTGSCGGQVGADGTQLLVADAADCTGGTIRNRSGSFGYQFTNTLHPHLTRVRVVDTGTSGIQAIGTSGFTLTGSWLKTNGANLAASVDLGTFNANMSGPITVTDSTVEGSRWNAVAVRVSAAATASLTGNQLLGETRHGREVVSRGATAFTADVRGNYYAGNAGANVVGGADLVGGVSGNIALTVASNTMDPLAAASGGSAVSVGSNVSANSNGTWAGLARFVVEDNRMTGNGGQGIVVSNYLGAPSGVVEGIVRNNVIGSSDQAGSCGGYGVEIYASSGDTTAAVTGNQMHRCGYMGTFVQQQAAARTVNATITDNVVDSLVEPSASYGVLVIAENSGTIPGCYDVRGNHLQHGPGTTYDMHMRTTGATPARIPGYTGSPTSAAAVSGYLSSLNNAASVETLLQSGGSFLGGGACAQPSS